MINTARSSASDTLTLLAANKLTHDKEMAREFLVALDPTATKIDIAKRFGWSKKQSPTPAARQRQSFGCNAEQPAVQASAPRLEA